MFKRTRLLGLVGLVAVGALLLGACDDDEDADATETPAATEAAAPTEAATEAPTEAATEAPTEAASAGAEATVLVGGNADLGDFLTGAGGLTLYTFANDEAAVSNCAGGCAEAWPPLLVEDGEPVAGDGVSGTLAVIDHPDGGRQVTYNDQPLYFYAADAAPGDAAGQGLNDVWFVATP